MPTPRCPLLVGREPELAAFRTALAGTWHGRGTALVVTEEPGIGKSRLLNEIAAIVDPDTPVEPSRDPPWVPARLRVEWARRHRRPGSQIVGAPAPKCDRALHREAAGQMRRK